MQVLHSHVADLSDKLLPLEPVFPLVSSHLESAARTLGRIPHEAPSGGGGDAFAAAAARRTLYCPAGRPGSLGAVKTRLDHRRSFLTAWAPLMFTAGRNGGAQREKQPQTNKPCDEQRQPKKSSSTWLIFPRWDGSNPVSAHPFSLSLSLSLSLSHIHTHTHACTSVPVYKRFN